MAVLITILIVGALLVLNELYVRLRSEPSEHSRKFIHITVGSFVAFWPFFLSWTEILLLSAAFVVVVSISKYFHIFRAIHSVTRPTYGEVFFGVAVGAVALITHSKGVYAAALLQMSLADGFAAIIGMRYGVSNRYKVLGNVKSIAGTATFFATSIALLSLFSAITDIQVGVVTMISLAAGASALENFGAHGLDNLFVPLLIATVLQIQLF